MTIPSDEQIAITITCCIVILTAILAAVFGVSVVMEAGNPWGIKLAGLSLVLVGVLVVLGFAVVATRKIMNGGK